MTDEEYREYYPLVGRIESIRDNVLTSGSTESLHHYTTSSALESIFNNDQLHISSSQFMNDKHEIYYFRDLVLAVIENTDIFSDLSEKRKKIYKSAILFMIDSWFYGLSQDTYILSSSVNAKSVGLWLSYNQGRGYSIEIDREALQNQVNSHFDFPIISGNVIYKKELQQNIVKKVITEIKNVFILFEEKFNWEITKMKFPWDGETLSLIYTIACMMKSETFSYEEEHRFVFINPNRNESCKIQYKIKNEVFLPYIGLNIDLSELVKSIQIGPYLEGKIANAGLLKFLGSKDLRKVIVKNCGIQMR